MGSKETGLKTWSNEKLTFLVPARDRAGRRPHDRYGSMSLVDSEVGFACLRRSDLEPEPGDALVAVDAVGAVVGEGDGAHDREAETRAARVGARRVEPVPHPG